ncbi:hypothetical protein ALT_7794 [Aspergillus lentulus]|uniref:Uncharacterized protein n=1 Tax=Aspergillus lentulus TaxID=293939 RepID=A0AAN4TD74_ASPLE|nr:uncharacterized protein IFM58399_07925 [Aspergillus lentulus]GAQ10473.1 hypothetical protein ALT_7794 [Aspergillus lentulus]GFF46943.1 hypothetical protein IFM58399_07925 [Aspergillus lentulus]
MENLEEGPLSGIQSDPLMLPGLSISLFHEHRDQFRIALHPSNITERCTSEKTLWEITMVHVMNKITDEPGWEKRVFDENCAREWRQKFLDIYNGLSPEMVDWVIEEVKFKAEIFLKKGMVTALDGGVVKSDIAVTEDIKLALQAAVEPLENIAEHDKDYERGSGGQIVNLVDPSLFALAYSRSQVLPDRVIGLDDYFSHSGRAKALEVKWEEHDPFSLINNGRTRTKHEFLDLFTAYSLDYQWLPCEIKFRDTTEGCRIASYINNLRPDHHGPLYDTLERIITEVIPLWNMSLTALRTERLHRRNRIKFERIEYLPSSNSLREVLELGSLSDFEDIYDRLWEREKSRPVKPPETGPISLWLDRLRSENPIDLQTTFRARGLQVIVKLANIELTPETPRYTGTPWHFQGLLNEHICATAIYNYSCENVTTPILSFRQRLSLDWLHENYFDKGFGLPWLPQVFGCNEEEKQIVELGQVSCHGGRLVTFPNIFQTSLAPVHLVDPGKPGHCKSLVLHPSTLMCVSSQRPTCHPSRQTGGMASIFEEMLWLRRGLPVELQDMVLDYLESYPLTIEEARELRLNLMRERDRITREQTEKLETWRF